MHDVIIVGSGPAGANAAAALVERGKRVLMLDAGITDDRYAALVPPLAFSELRRSDEQQHRYLLGGEFEGIGGRGVRTGAQLTPPRLYVTRTPDDLRVHSDTFAAAESLALGGLGSAWGAGVFEFDDDELSEWPIGRAELVPHYDAVAARIGVTGSADDLARFFPAPRPALPALEIDDNAASLLDNYSRRRAQLNARGFYMGRVPLAVCTVRYRDRGPHDYRDMDFWSDADRSVYRPRFTIEELRARPNFTYQSGQLVLRFSETSDGVVVTARHLRTSATAEFSGRALLIGAGTLGTTRIVLRSLGRYGARVPLLCNPYTYAPVINARMLGRVPRDRRYSLAQLSAVYQPRGDGGARAAVQVQFYSYRSLLTHRLLAESPLAYREGLRVMRHLIAALGILGINHEDRRTALKYCELRRYGDQDMLHVQYSLSSAERARLERSERDVLRLFRRVGARAIRRVHPGHGSSIHYAGTFPMSGSGEELTSLADGRLAGARAVYLVDGSVFPYLPAKGLTFTIMANANRVASIVADRLS